MRRKEKEKDKPKEEIALTMDGTAHLRYDTPIPAVIASFALSF